MPTERETIARERVAYMKGADDTHDARLDCARDRADAGFYRWCASPIRGAQPVLDTDALRVAAFARYPLPKVTRPRVVADPHAQNVLWKAVNGELSQGLEGLNGRGRDWAKIVALHVPTPPTRARVALWADLIANPTEDVDDDA